MTIITTPVLPEHFNPITQAISILHLPGAAVEVVLQ
jgi:hypothetical protein